LVIGDFDSLQGPLPDGIQTVTLPKEKDETDMCAALRAGMRRGYYTFHIYGGLGGRIDHSLANIQCIADIANSGARGYLFGNDTVITAISNSNISFAKASSGTISVFSHTDTSEGVYETGMKYALFNATLQNGFPKGISNEFTDEAASISVRSGTLIIMYPPGAQVIR
jgi:thiamine pyrophosphokinase